MFLRLPGKCERGWNKYCPPSFNLYETRSKHIFTEQEIPKWHRYVFLGVLAKIRSLMTLCNNLDMEDQKEQGSSWPEGPDSQLRRGQTRPPPVPPRQTVRSQRRGIRPSRRRRRNRRRDRNRRRPCSRRRPRGRRPSFDAYQIFS